MPPATLQLQRDSITTSTLYACHDVTVPIHQIARITKKLSDGVYHAEISGSVKSIRVLKCATGLTELRRMENEYEFYSIDLFSLQGTVIPRCYGFYKGQLETGPFGCLILEPLEVGLMDGPVDIFEFHRQMMIGFCKIHEAGVYHGNLFDGTHIGRVGLCPKIFSFSVAKRHQCLGCPPANDKGRIPAGIPVCSELISLEKFYGLKSGDPPRHEDVSASTTRLGQVMARLRITFGSASEPLNVE